MFLTVHWKSNDIKRPKGEELAAAIDGFWTRNGEKPPVKKIWEEKLAEFEKTQALTRDMGELDL